MRLPRVVLVLGTVLAMLLPAVAVAQGPLGSWHTLVAQLRGDTEIPPGDPDGLGFAKINVNLDTGEVCYRLSAANIAPSVGAHIHAGMAGTTGPVVVPLAAVDADGLASGCGTADAALLADIVMNPANYYVNVHSTEFPAGAVRGQLSLIGEPPAAGPPPTPEPTLEVVLDGLANPRGVDMAGDGSLYVALAGSGGDECVEAPIGGEPSTVCLGMTAGVIELVAGSAEMVGGGLPSVADEGGFGALGAHDIAVDADGELYATVGLGADPAVRETIGGIAAELGRVAEAADDGSWMSAADLAGYEAANNPDGGLPDSNPYGIVADGDLLLVADAGANALNAIHADGTIHTVAVFPDEMVEAPDFLGLPPGTMIPMQAVPTSVAVGPDGAWYVGQLTGFPGPAGAAKIWRLEDMNGDGDAMDAGEQSVYASGLTAIVDIEFDADGNLYVVQFANGGWLAAEMAEPGDMEALIGSIVMIGADGHQHTAVDGLVVPGGVAVDADGSLWVTNYSIMPDMGELVHVTMP